MGWEWGGGGRRWVEVGGGEVGCGWGGGGGGAGGGGGGEVGCGCGGGVDSLVTRGQWHRNRFYVLKCEQIYIPNIYAQANFQKNILQICKQHTYQNINQIGNIGFSEKIVIVYTWFISLYPKYREPRWCIKPLPEPMSQYYLWNQNYNQRWIYEISIMSS